MLEVRLKRKLPGFTLDVSFVINQEILTILGPSGSGKTMTLQCIAGLILPDEGYVRLNNKVLFDSISGCNLPTRMRKIGFVFQNYALFPHLTVNQNIGYGIAHLSAEEIQDRVAELREKMNIATLGESYPRHLSAGQQQRVAVARALAPEPELLLLDEPFSALDSLVKERMQLELQTLQHFYRGNMLFVTHDLTEGYKLSSRIAVFESGHIVQQDKKDKVVASPSNKTVARLVGFKNILEGFVIEVEEMDAIIRVPGLEGLLRAKITPNLNLENGQHVTIGIRPEYVQFKDQSGENTFLCEVNQIVDGVTTTNYHFDLNKSGITRHQIMMTLSRCEFNPIHEGQSGYLFLPAERVIVIKD